MAKGDPVIVVKPAPPPRPSIKPADKTIMKGVKQKSVIVPKPVVAKKVQLVGKKSGNR